MLEKPIKRKIDKQDKQLPQNLEQLIEYYDLEKIWVQIEKIIDEVNKQEDAIQNIKSKGV